MGRDLTNFAPDDIRNRKAAQTWSQLTEDSSGSPVVLLFLRRVLVTSFTFAVVVEFGNNASDPTFCMFSIQGFRCLSCADPSGENVARSYSSKKFVITIS